MDLIESFKNFAKKEIDFYDKAKNDTLYQRIIPNFKNKDNLSIEYYYNGIILSGLYIKESNSIKLRFKKFTKYANSSNVLNEIKSVMDILKKSGVTVCEE